MEQTRTIFSVNSWRQLDNSPLLTFYDFLRRSMAFPDATCKRHKP